MLSDWAISLSALVADSLQREELGEMGTVSKFEAGAAKDDPLFGALELTTNGRAAETESDSATETVMGNDVAFETRPSCKLQERACRALPADS